MTRSQATPMSSQIILLERMLERLQAALDAKTADFDRLCKDFDAHDAELKRIIAGMRVELAQANLYMPGRRAEPMPKTEHGEFCKKYWWNQTDEEFAASGKPYVEVTG